MRQIIQTYKDEETGEEFDMIFPAEHRDYIVVDWGNDCNGSRYTLHGTKDSRDYFCNFSTVDSLGDAGGVRFKIIYTSQVKDSDKVHLHCMDYGPYIDDKKREKEFKALFDNSPLTAQRFL